VSKLYKHASRTFGCLAAALFVVAVLAGGQAQVRADPGVDPTAPVPPFDCLPGCPPTPCLIPGFWCTYYAPDDCKCAGI
jgi:hypothetical protein